MTSPLKEALTALADVCEPPSGGNPIRVVSLWTTGRGTLCPDQRRTPMCKLRSIASTRSIWRSSVKDDATRQRKTIDCGTSCGGDGDF